MEELRYADKRKPKSGKYLKAHGYFDEFITIGTFVKKRSMKRFTNDNYVETVVEIGVINEYDPRGYPAVRLSSGQVINSANLVPCLPIAPDHLYEPTKRGWLEYLKRST